MSTVIVIPAKSTPSVRLPGKNHQLKLPNGQTLLERACGLAVSVVGSENVFISGDPPPMPLTLGSPQHGIIRRPDCGPDLVDVMQDAIETLEHNHSDPPRYTQYILLQVTNPFVTATHLNICQTQSHIPWIGIDSNGKHCGAFYAAHPDLWMKHGTAWYDDAETLLVNPSVDIDEPEHFALACRLLEEQCQK